MRVKTLPFPLPAIPPKFTTEDAYEQNNRLSKKLFNDFFKWQIEKSQRILARTTAEEWEKAGQGHALEVFHTAAERVPAYKDFLKKNGIDHHKIKTVRDFKNIPTVNKQNYLREYSLSDLSWDGVLHSSQIISVSSGSTGKPFFWPRGGMLELETTYLFETIFSTSFATHSASTLFVNAFAMGMYVGGPITLNCTLRIGQKGHSIVIVTPGYNIEEILRVIKELGPGYEQTVLASYPPFAKDIIDDGREQGIDWHKLKVKFLLAGESYSEKWRDYIANITGSDPHRHFVNLYGTADAAILGHETPTSTALRRTFDQDVQVRSQIFGEERLPSLLQYYPNLRYFELVEEELVFTSAASIPLIRYNIHDRGGLLTFSEAIQKAEDLGVNVLAELENRDLPIWQLPMVYVFGRSDFTAVFYGANIYPENIRAGLERPEVREQVTGKFTMFTDTDESQSQRLIINVECANHADQTPELSDHVQQAIIDALLERNYEYRVVFSDRGEKARPKVELWPRGHHKYFARGTKHRWTLNG